MKRVLLAAVVGMAVLAFSCPSFAQLSPEEAQARLAARQAEEAATTQPSVQDQETQLAELRQVIATLREENAQLKQEIIKLQQPTTKPVDEKADAISEAIKNHTLVVGMTLAEATKSAGSFPMLLNAKGTTSHYMWEIQGPTGKTIEARDELGHARRVPKIGVAETVEATFVKGKLTEFSRTKPKESE